MKCTKNDLRGGISRLGRVSLYVAISVVALLMWHCAAEDGLNSKQNPDPVLAYVHTPDYSVYNIDIAYADGSTKVKALTFETSGLFAKRYTDKNKNDLLLVVTSSSPTGKLHVYSLYNFDSELCSLNLGVFPQEIAIYDNTIYIAIRGEDSSIENGVVKSIRMPTACDFSSTDIEVKKNPTNLLVVDNTMYVTNQDTGGVVGTRKPSVSVVDLSNNIVTKTVDVGENPAALAWDGTTLFSYDSKYYDGSTPSISYNINSAGDGTSAAKIDLSGVTGSERPAYGGSMATEGTTTYALFSDGTWGATWYRYKVSTTGISDADKDASKDYLWVGSHKTQLYEAYAEGGKTKVTGGDFGSKVIELSTSGGEFRLLK